MLGALWTNLSLHFEDVYYTSATETQNGMRQVPDISRSVDAKSCFSLAKVRIAILVLI